MIEFANNNAVFSSIKMIFFVNREFYSKINFNSNIISYSLIKKRLLITKIENILNTMQKILNYLI